MRLGRFFSANGDILCSSRKGVTNMKMCIGFWAGIGAGMMAGAVVGMMLPYGRDPMKTQVGKSIHKLGVAVDHAVDSLVSEMH